MPSLRDPKVAIVGVGATPYYPRGESWPQTIDEMICKAILAACDDAGINVREIDGFAYYSKASGGYYSPLETHILMETLGIPEIKFTGTITGGGGGSVGAIGMAEMALTAGDCKYVVTLMALQQAPSNRLGTIMADKPPTPDSSFVVPAGLIGPGYMTSVLARRHMYKYGTRREAFAEVAISTRLNAMNRPTAVKREPLTLDDYFNARMISDPHCLYDFCLETDGAVAVITTTTERAKDCRKKPVNVLGAVHGGVREWGRSFTWMNMPDDWFATAGHKRIAERLWEKTGVTSKDIDVALIYDHFTSLVVMQLEDYGFCGVGEGGAFVESGAIRYKGGSIPVNTHGGQLSEGYIVGMTHIREAVEQLRGEAINQVAGASLALVTGGPASIPTSGMVLQA